MYSGARVASDTAMKQNRPRPVKDQVIVITGASSGIGLTTARMAARRGARVVMAARNETDLRAVADEDRDAPAGAAAARQGMSGMMWNSQKAFDRTQPAESSLEHPQPDGRAYGPHTSMVLNSSAYTKAALSPTFKGMTFAAAGVALAAGLKRWRAA